jgi:endoglucanase
MNRRQALRKLATLASVLSGVVPLNALAQVPDENPIFSGPNNPLAAPWAAWKAAYLTEDGRVVDALQQGASHSESQGYGLALAAIFGDNDTFDRIYAWTEANLAIRSDALLAWRWLPADSGGVPDLNNASDGDLFYAWGLVIRAQRDGDAALMDRARAIAADLVAKCVVLAPDGTGRLLFLPAAQGFTDENGATINLSYYMPLAMRDLARATDTPALATCAADGAAIMQILSREGPMPDWIGVGPNGLFTPAKQSDRNGYEAMRVALFLIWSGNPNHPAVAAQMSAYRGAQIRARLRLAGGENVTVFDRKTGGVMETSKHVGYGALPALMDCLQTRIIGSTIPSYQTLDQAYYPATLHLMVLIAQIIATPECVPI